MDIRILPVEAVKKWNKKVTADCVACGNTELDAAGFFRILQLGFAFVD